MNRVYLAQLEQLKCNFCTQWFSVQSEFAALQKYSLNACQKCLADFRYRLVDPTSYQIYDVLLVKTGYELTSKQHLMDEQLDCLLKMQVESRKLSENCANAIKNDDMQNRDLRAELEHHTQPIKERVSLVCRRFMQGMLSKWSTVLDEIDKGSRQFSAHKEKLINALSDRHCDFSSLGPNLSSSVEDKANLDKVRLITDQVKNMTADKMVAKIKAFIGELFGFAQPQVVKEITNKENVTPNKRKNLKNIREKLMKASRLEVQQKTHYTSSSNLKSSRNVSDKSSRRPSPRPHQAQLKVLNKERSQKSLLILQKTPKTPRPQLIQSVVPACQDQSPLDEYRIQMSKLLHQKPAFESYMRVAPEKSESILNKTYGQKCMVEYLVELKLKTTITDQICELINENLVKCNLECYLRSLEWRSSVHMVRFVKVNMSDYQFDCFLNWLGEKKAVQTLVLTNNFLTELSVEAMHAFCVRNPGMSLKHIYMGNNFIKPSKARKFIEQLKILNICVHI